jgi:hypothetical protein
MEVKLSGEKGEGIITIVSKEDYDEVIKYNWYLRDDGYVDGTVNKRKIGLNRFIMKPTDRLQLVDHINQNILDNRRENLRISTYQLNGESKKVSKNKKSSKFKGVFFHKKNNRYQVQFKYNKKSHYIGKFINEIDAAEAYDMYLVHNKLNHLNLNFPNKRQEYLKKEYIPFERKQHNNKYIGVNKIKDKYVARIKINNKKVHLGTKQTEIECAALYDEYIIKNNIINKTLNFPDKYPDYEPVKIKKTECQELDNNIVKLLIKSDKDVLIDKEDYDKIKYFICYVIEQRKRLAVKIQIDNENKTLSRFLMNVSDPLVYIDHIDSNTLNNTKNNLRISDEQKNAQNKSKQANASTSQYIGVSYDTRDNRWLTKIRKNYKDIFTGYYDNEELAARSRDIYIMKNLKDDHYKLNFNWADEDIEKWQKKLDNVSNNKKKITSKYKGIGFNKSINKWVTRMIQNKKTVFQKTYKSEEDATRARDLYILNNNLNNKKLNFRWTEKEIDEWKIKLNM